MTGALWGVIGVGVQARDLRGCQPKVEVSGSPQSRNVELPEHSQFRPMEVPQLVAGYLLGGDG